MALIQINETSAHAVQAAEVQSRLKTAAEENRLFWLAIREALLVMVRAIERKFLPDLKRSCGRRQGE